MVSIVCNFLWVGVVLIAAPIWADIHPFSSIDLVTFDRISGSIPSPDSHYVAFVVSRYNIDNNTNESSIHLLCLDDDSIAEVTNPIPPIVDSEPLWLSSNLLAFSRGGQIHYIDVSVFLGDAYQHSVQAAKPEVRQLTHFPIDIGNVKFHRESSTLVFTAEVFDDGEMENAIRKAKEEKEKFDSGKVYNGLFVRHWDVFTNPQKRSNLFVVKLKVEATSATISGNPINLMKGMDIETPVAPFGDSSNYAISPDGEEIAFSSRVPEPSAAWTTNTDIFTIFTNNTMVKPKNLSVKNKGYDNVPAYSPDGRFIAWLQMQTPKYEADRNRIVLYDRHNGTERVVTEHWDRSPESLLWSPDSANLWVTTQESGHVKIFVVNHNSGDVIEIVSKHSNAALAHILDKDGNSDQIIFEQSSWISPVEIYTFNRNSDDEPKRRTNLNGKHLNETLLGDPEEFWFKGAKGDAVMGWLFKPVGILPSQRYPLAHLVHGGPEGSWNDGFSFRWNPQVYAGAGFAVVIINFHGSTGYGSRFTRSILGHWGAAPYEDLMLGIDHALKKYPFIDGERMCTLGASYGGKHVVVSRKVETNADGLGYMVNWINGHTDRFACLVNHDGMFDTRASYFATDELFFPEFEFAGTPYQKHSVAIYDKWNPALHVHKWKTPTLVVHGERDYRLPVTEGLSTFTALQRKGVPSRFLYFPDENHWILKPANSLRWHKEVLEWIHSWTTRKQLPESNMVEVGKDGTSSNAKLMIQAELLDGDNALS